MAKLDSTKRSDSLAALALLALVTLSFGASLGGEFVWDDAPLIVENSMVKVTSEIPKLLSSSFWETGDKHDRFRAFFRPLVSLSYALDYAVWGLRPFGFHLTNLLLHFVCCWLLYRILREERFGSATALAGAGLFAVHPVHVESVAWISGRTDLVCALFVLAAFLAHLRARRGALAPRVVSWVLFALALFSKEMAATLPALIFAERLLSGGKSTERVRRAAAAAAPYMAILVVYLAVRVAVLTGGAPPLYALGTEAWVATAAFALGRYLTLLLLPVGLDAHYPYAPLTSWFTPAALVATLMLVIVGVAAWSLRHRAPRGLFWIAWVFIGLTPVMTFGRFGDVIMADRFLYLPSVGVAALFALALRFVSETQRLRRVVAGVTVVLLIGLAGLSWQRANVWSSDHRLFSDMLETSPDSALVRNNYGLALYARGDLQEAAEQFRLAVVLSPSYAMAHNNLAASLERHGRHDAALRHYRESLELAPGLVRAERNLAHLLYRLGRTDEGMERMSELLRQHPGSPDVLYAAADILYGSGAVTKAATYLERARRIDPWHAESHYLLGKIRHEQGRVHEAAAMMRRFLELWPDDAGDNAAAARWVIAGAEPGGEDPTRPR